MNKITGIAYNSTESNDFLMTIEYKRIQRSEK